VEANNFKHGIQLELKEKLVKNNYSDAD